MHFLNEVCEFALLNASGEDKMYPSSDDAVIFSNAKVDI
jgi:hypothetical protein